jgi:hypothetical protein
MADDNYDIDSLLEAQERQVLLATIERVPDADSRVKAKPRSFMRA